MPIDLDTLLAPAEGEIPTGDDLRANPSPTSAYYTVKDARNSARSLERQAMLEGDGPTPDWRKVLEKSVETLKKSKDLEIVAYLIEALVRLEGFTGLRDGFRLTRGYVEQYWDHLYPMPDEEGISTRVAPLTGLNGDEGEGTLISPIANVPLTQGNSAGPYSYVHYQQAVAVAQIGDPEAREKRIQQGAVSIDMFERAIAETPGDWLVDRVLQIQQCLDEFAQLTALLDEKCGSQSPPASNIRSILQSCLETVQTMGRDKLGLAAPPPGDESGASDASAGQGAGGETAVGSGPIRTREDAFRLLLKVAEYFRQAEPHTPIYFALEQAVRWGRMELPELLTELITDENVRNSLFRQVGIRLPPPS